MIPLMKSTFLNEGETKTALAEFIVNSTKLSMGTECLNFERSFSIYQNRKEAILFNSGGSANLAMLQALKNLGKFKDGDRIGFSALTWSTNVMPIIQMGLTPIPIDCNISTLNVMCNNVAAVIENLNIKGIFVTNVLGFTGDLENIKDICESKNVILLEDNCESLGTELFHTKAGNFGLASSFSFFVAHHMSTIEGGMLVTDDAELAEMLRIVRANGWDRNLTSFQQNKWRNKFNIKSEFDAKYTFYDLGFNFRPTEITGFLGQFQLQFLKENIIKRIENYLLIEKTIEKNDEIILLNRDHIKRLSSFAIPVVCRNKELRTKYFNKFSEANIEIRPIIAGNMQKQPFFKKYVKNEFLLPNTDFIHNCGFYCGNYPELSADDLFLISRSLEKQ